MIPHKYADLIHAWADGKTIQLLNKNTYAWFDITEPNWYDCHAEFRIKPERKPNVIKYIKTEMYKDGISRWDIADFSYANLVLTFDGETGEPIYAEVLK